MKDIIIFTQFYPFTHYDIYFQRELFEFPKYYDRIFLVSGNLDSSIVQPVPSNTKVYRFLPNVHEKNKLLLLAHMFSKDFFMEMMHALRIVSFKNLLHGMWYALSSIEKSKVFKTYLDALIATENISSDQLTVYSYWMLEHAHASGKLKRRHPQLKNVVRAHGSDLYFDRSPINYLPLKKLIFDSVNAIYFISESGKNYFENFHRIKKESAGKLRVSRLALPPGTSPKLKEETPKGFFRIVSNAYVQWFKRIDLIAEGLKEITDLQIEWIHFGGMHERVTEFDLFRKNMGELLSQNSNIRFDFKGDTGNEDIIRFYENNFVDLFISVSTTEGIPVSIMEVFSFGIPAIATAVGGTGEIVNNENGMLLPGNLTARDLSAAIKTFLLKPDEEKEQFRLNAFATWKEKFNAEINYPGFVQEVAQL